MVFLLEDSFKALIQMINNRNFTFSSLVMLLLILPSIVWAQAALTIETNKKQIEIGDVLEVQIRVNNVANTAQIAWPQWTDELLKIDGSTKHLEIVNEPLLDSVNENNKWTYIQRIGLSAYDSGIFEFPAFTIDVKDSAQQVIVLKSAAFPVQVTTVAVDTTQEILPIKPIIEVEMTWLDYWEYIAIAGCLLLVIIIVLWWYIKRPKKEIKPIPVEEVSQTLAEEMSAYFEQFKAKHLLQKGAYKEYYSELSTIVRIYISKRYYINALEMTTQQMLHLMQKKHLNALQYQQFKDLLQTADLVKFAKAQPTIEAMNNALLEAEEFVATTLPKPPLDEKNINAK